MQQKGERKTGAMRAETSRGRSPRHTTNRRVLSLPIPFILDERAIALPATTT
jgi:hypothetical protein